VGFKPFDIGIDRALQALRLAKPLWGGFRASPLRHDSVDNAVSGNGADWDRILSIREWAKLIALSLAVSTALTALVAASVWLIARQHNREGIGDGTRHGEMVQPDQRLRLH
jgi:hypothetical protein